jgi:hypothetical protein
MSDFTLNEDGELVDGTGDVVADETAVSIANVLVASLRRYEADRAIFVEDREARKVNGASDRVIMAKMDRVKVDDETRKAYDELIGDFIERFAALQSESAGVLGLLFNDIQRSGRISQYLITEATEVAKGLKVSGVVPTIEDLTKRATKVRGLWTSLMASVDSIEAIKALGVPCEVTNKGRSDGTTWVVSMPELPKIKAKVEADKITKVLCDGKEIWRSGTEVNLGNALSLLKIKPSEFERDMQLSEKVDSEGNKIEGTQQDIFSLNLTHKGHHFTSEVIENTK